MSSPATAPSTPSAPSAPPRLALIELLERDGRPGRTVDVFAWPVTLGRALDNDVVLDDPHIAAQHALLVAGADGAVTLQPLPTRNGVRLNGRLARAATVVPAGGAAAGRHTPAPAPGR